MVGGGGPQSGVVAGTVALVTVEASTDLDVEIEVPTLHLDSHGNGYATEAARGVLARGHDAGLAEILALTDPANTPCRQSAADSGRAGRH